MGKYLDLDIDDKLIKKTEKFNEKIESSIVFKSKLSTESSCFEYLDDIVMACPFIDNLVKRPKVTLTDSSEVTKIELAKKIGVESIRDLSRNTQYIEKVSRDGEEITPNKILGLFSEEIVGTYENKVLYTLIRMLMDFMNKLEDLIKNFESSDNKTLEYVGKSTTGKENVMLELKVTSSDISSAFEKEGFEDELERLKGLIKKINDFIKSWKKSYFYKIFEKAKQPYIRPPIQKTNLILKNPNFQMAMRLWAILQDIEEDLNTTKKRETNKADKIVNDILNDSFLQDYFLVDSMSISKKEQRERLSRYAVLMIKNQIQRSMALLLDSGIKISDDKILAMVSNELNKEKSKRLIGAKDIRKKFKSEIEEYLEKAKEVL